MPKTVHAVALAALALASSAAMAADVSPVSALSLVGAYDWQGPYVGLNLGYQRGWVSNSSARPSGVAGGVQGGYNWQRGALVFGAEADLQGSDADDVFAAWKFSNPWFGTLRGRAGLALNNVMLYGTLGLAYGTLRAQSGLGGITELETSVGFAAGLGVEVAVMGNWTARAEYLYVDLGERSYSLTGTNHAISSGFLRLGVNYRF
jgi:outer membrane immunogenic protein